MKQVAIDPAMRRDDVPPLFAPMPPHNGTATSVAAAEAIRPTVASLRADVLAFIASRPEGATDQEISIGTGIVENTVRPRRGELIDAGHIVNSGFTRPTTSGRRAVVWRVA